VGETWAERRARRQLASISTPTSDDEDSGSESADDASFASDDEDSGSESADDEDSGSESVDDEGEPVITAASIPKFSSCDAGFDHTVAVSQDGNLYRWGLCGGLEECDWPTLVGGDLREKIVVAASCGYSHILALTDAGEVYAMGGTDLRARRLHRQFPELGLGAVEEPVVVPTSLVQGPLRGFRVVKVSAGYKISAAITACGKLFTWGWSENYALGHGNINPFFVPTLVQNSLRGKWVVDVSCGCDHIASVTADGQLFTMGKRDYGRLGYETNTLSRTSLPGLVKGLLPHSCTAAAAAAAGK
jgi:alpha-tubulin suppressor-like RCC1 family protein